MLARPTGWNNVVCQHESQYPTFPQTKPGWRVDRACWVAKIVAGSCAVGLIPTMGRWSVVNGIVPRGLKNLKLTQFRFSLVSLLADICSVRVDRWLGVAVRLAFPSFHCSALSAIVRD